MRGLALLCALFVMGPSVLFCQPKATIVGGLSFDFGNLYSSMKVKKLVTIRNEGSDTLKVFDVSTSCGCTGTLLSQPLIAPGDSGTIEISFDPRRFSGAVEKAISMKTNDAKNANPHIMFTANIVKLVEVDPEYVIFRTTAGQPATEQVSFSNASDRSVNILSISSSSPLLTFGSFEKVLSPGHPVEIPCTFAPTTSGAHNGDIVVRTDDANIPVISVRFFALVKDPAPEVKK